MAQSSRALFIEESDEDSIPTDSTEDSEHDDDESFHVEKILAFHQNHDNSGNPAYLIKWEGYELGRSSWEPPENLEDERLIQDFEIEQERVKKGLAVQFDEKDFVEACEKILEDKSERHKRRVAKRRKRAERKAFRGDRSKRNLLTKDRRPRGNAESSDENEDVTTRLHGLQADKPPSVRRKGIAQKTQPRRRFVLESSSDEADGKSPDADNDSAFNSLFDEDSQPLYQEPRALGTKSSKTGTSGKAPESRPVEASKPASNQLETAMAMDKHDELTQKAARKSVITPGPSKANTASKSAKRSNAFAKPNENLLRKKQRPDTNISTTQEATMPKHTNLAIQNRDIPRTDQPWKGTPMIFILRRGGNLDEVSRRQRLSVNQRNLQKFWPHRPIGDVEKYAGSGSTVDVSDLLQLAPLPMMSSHREIFRLRRLHRQREKSCLMIGLGLRHASIGGKVHRLQSQPPKTNRKLEKRAIGG
ncbi:hypothetical protein KC356_g277 [Hortaea werneckii]|nr:hypothetical protein KC356_g277 [Hortaea werneckii]